MSLLSLLLRFRNLDQKSIQINIIRQTNENQQQNQEEQKSSFSRGCFQRWYAIDDLAKPDHILLKQYFSNQWKVSKTLIISILKQLSQITKNQPNVIIMTDPVTIVGDIHGQFYDLLKMFEMAGPIVNQKFLFLGDYIDRGMFSIQTFTYIAALKINYPKQFIMLRGNHECRQLTSHFNFRTECLSKFDQQVYQYFMDCCDALPLACVINNKFFAVHGGISPEQLDMKLDLNQINRFKQPPKSGVFCDLLWADPINNKALENSNFSVNTNRGCSIFFGKQLANSFLKKFKLTTIIRAHQAQHRGYSLHRWGNSEFPSVITIFSAPNYCDSYGNKGAIIKLSNSSVRFIQYASSPHPFVLPNFMDLFTWSLPFLVDKLTEIVSVMMNQKKNLQQESQDSEVAFNEYLISARDSRIMNELMMFLKAQNQPKNQKTQQQFQDIKKKDKNEMNPCLVFGPKVNHNNYLDMVINDNY